MAVVFGKYQMLTRIASGGMAEVWLARSSSIGGFEKLLAIKKMHGTLSRNQSFVSMFIDEAKLTVSLSHPNIVQIFDFGRVDDDYFMAMEYVEGFDLATIAKRARKNSTPLPVDMCVYILRAVFDGLAYAHTRGDRQGKSGVIHRDVSPQNILVSFDGHVKVSDFGIARAITSLEKTQKSEKAHQHEIFGKLAYVSPEQSRGHVVTASTDIWAAGVILHELLTNQRLFVRENDYQTIEAVIESEIPPPKLSNPDVPAELNDTVIRVLERDLVRRPSSAREVAEALAEILRRYYPGATDYRLSDVISALWGHRLPRLLPAAGDGDTSTRGERPALSIESTMPVGEHTAAEIAAVAKRSRGISAAGPWARTPATRSPPERPESLTQLDLGRAPVLDTVQDSASASASSVGAGARATVEESPPTETTIADDNLRAAGALAKELVELRKRFVADPNLWVLVDIGRIYERAGMKKTGMGAFKLAAAKFAQRGLLAQAATIYAMILKRTGMTEAIREEVKRLRSLQGVSDELIHRSVFDPADETADFSEYEIVFSAQEGPVDVYTESPIFSSLSGEQLVGLVQGLSLRTYQIGDTIVREGQEGDSFFVIGRGRVVVSVTNFEQRKIYVTSLADGDCFGEQSFFTGEPRSATVEAHEDVLALEISKEALNRLVVEFPTVRESLRKFYKERIAESLLAKSPLFGHLSTSARKMFAERFGFETYEPGDLIIKEGDQSDAFYAIKAGRVSVYTGAHESPILLAELSRGDIFGEIAALEGTVRTANVRALTECEILRLEAAELNAMLAKNAEIRRMIEEKIEARAEERLRKIIESS